jgi:hypothetical protein
MGSLQGEHRGFEFANLCRLRIELLSELESLELDLIQEHRRQFIVAYAIDPAMLVTNDEL